MKLNNWLTQNNIKFSFVNENDFTVPEVGLFHFIGHTDDKIFDESFNFLI